MNFKVIDDGKEIECNILFTFKDETSSINYVIYTDGIMDKNGEFNIYASRYEIKNGDYYLESIKSEKEWDLVDNMLEANNVGEI